MAGLDWHDTLAELISHRTVSSGNPDLNCGNRAAVEALANRLEHAGLACEISPLPGLDDKVNLIAHSQSTVGSGHTVGVRFRTVGVRSRMALT